MRKSATLMRINVIALAVALVIPVGLGIELQGLGVVGDGLIQLAAIVECGGAILVARHVLRVVRLV